MKITKTGLKIFILGFIILLSRGVGISEGSPPEITLSANDRIIIFAPHPDDEVLGCGGIIQKARELNIPVRIVFLTYGDNNEWSFMVYRKRPVILPKSAEGMGMVRAHEAIAAEKKLGISSDNITFLGYPDFKTLDIWYSRWGNARPVKSMLTRVRSVPYSNAYRPGAAYKGEEILSDIKNIISEFKPTKIFLSHPSDFNSDHRALYLFCRVALWDLKKDVNAELFPYLTHYSRWPVPKGLHTDMPLDPPHDLASAVSWEYSYLSSDETELKLLALREHKSQYQSNTRMLSSFIRVNELFGDFPTVKLRQKDPPLSLSKDEESPGDVMPEELTDEERNEFVGLEKRVIELENNVLILNISLSRKLNRRTGVSTYVFGYRQDRDFGDMPKICVKLGINSWSIYDGRHRLSRNSVKVERNRDGIKIYFPMDLLGGPEYILTSARTYLEDISLDRFSWRILEISK